MERRHNTQYRFGPYILEPDERRISGEGASRIDMTAKAFDLLVLLVSKAGQLVTKDEILDAVWQEVSIAESNLTTTISMIRKALQEDPQHRYIENVSKKGYRFVAPVSVDVDPDRGGTDPIDPTLAPPAPDGNRWLRLRLPGLLVVLIAAGIGFWILHYRRPAPIIPKTPFQDAINQEAEGNDNLAFIELNGVPQSDPMFAEAKLKAAWLLYQADRDDEAMSCLAPVTDGNVALGHGPQDKATGLKIQGLNKLLHDLPSEALDDFRSAADANPNDVDALIYIADTAINNDNRDNLGEADNALDKCRVLASLNTFCGYERIDALTREGRFVDAIDEYNRLRKGSNNPWLDQPAGYAELAKGDTEKALTHFNSLAAFGRGRSAVHFMGALDGIAAILVFQGKLEEAHMKLEAAASGADAKFEKVDYIILMAEIDALHGDLDRAKKELDDASKLHGSPALSIEIAKNYALSGDPANAKALLTRLNKDAPNLGLKYAAAEPFVAGIESLRKNDFEQAKVKLTSSFFIDQSPETAYFLAKAEMGLGNWDAAICNLNFIVSKKVKVIIDSVASLIPLSEYDLGVCYRAKGQESAAQNHFSSARETWKDADPELKALFTNSVSSAATKIRNGR